MPDPLAALTIDVARLADGWPDLPVEAAALAALAEVDDPHKAELSVALSDDAHIRALNRDFRGKDKPTNVLSFPMPRGSGMMGDVVLALETLQREAVEQDKSFADHATHMLVHGVLHLQGFDHQDEASALDMEAREVRALASLSIDNPYRDNNG